MKISVERIVHGQSWYAQTWMPMRMTYYDLATSQPPEDDQERRLSYPRKLRERVRHRTLWTRPIRLYEFSVSLRAQGEYGAGAPRSGKRLRPSKLDRPASSRCGQYLEYAGGGIRGPGRIRGGGTPSPAIGRDDGGGDGGPRWRCCASSRGASSRGLSPGARALRRGDAALPARAGAGGGSPGPTTSRRRHVSTIWLYSTSTPASLRRQSVYIGGR